MGVKSYKIEELFDVSNQVHNSLDDLIEKENALRELKFNYDLAVDTFKVSISEELTEAGKKVFSNDILREAELKNRLYQNGYNTLKKDIEDKELEIKRVRRVIDRQKDFQLDLRVYFTILGKGV